MFNSPLDHCPRCGEMVVLDQAVEDCAREHHCAQIEDCPLRHMFCDHPNTQLNITESSHRKETGNEHST